MNNICEYPVLNFNPHLKKMSSIRSMSKPNNSKRPNTQYNPVKNEKSFNNILPSNEDIKYSTHNNFYRGSNNIRNDRLYTESIEKEKEKDENILYKRKGMFIKEFGPCDVKFYIENKEFKILVTKEEISYFIEIDRIEDIMKMQNLYRNYDQIIENLMFENDEINFIQQKDNFIEYKTMKQMNS